MLGHTVSHTCLYVCDWNKTCFSSSFPFHSIVLHPTTSRSIPFFSFWKCSSLCTNCIYLPLMAQKPAIYRQYTYNLLVCTRMCVVNHRRSWQDREQTLEWSVNQRNKVTVATPEARPPSPGVAHTLRESSRLSLGVELGVRSSTSDTYGSQGARRPPDRLCDSSCSPCL